MYGRLDFLKSVMVSVIRLMVKAEMTQETES